MRERWLPVASLIGAALVLGVGAWLLLGRGGAAGSLASRGSGRAASEAGNPDAALAEPARADAHAAAEPASPGAEDPVAADHESPVAPERVLDRAEVDVRGWILVAAAGESRPREEGWVVLQSVPESPVRCRVAAPLHDGRFTTRLPANAIVTADRVELDERQAHVAGETFDVAESTLIEIHCAWAPPTTPRVVDAASGVDLRDVRLTDEYGKPIGRHRLLMKPGEERELSDSPLLLSPPFARYSFVWSERLRVGAPGRGTEEIVLVHGRGEERTVALGTAARLVVSLAPWPPPAAAGSNADDDPIHVRVALHRMKPAGTVVDDDRNTFQFGEGVYIVSKISGETLGDLAIGARNKRAPDESGTVVYEDLPGGRWLATVDFSSRVRGMIARDERWVGVEPGASSYVTLGLTRPAASATLLVRAHDVKSAEVVELAAHQVSVRRVANSDQGIKGSDDGARFETSPGAVEVVIRALGERAWRATRTFALLEPGENVVDVALESCAAVRLTFRGQGGDGHILTTSGSAQFRSQMALINAVDLRDARGQVVPGPWFYGHECWWLVEPGRYELTTPGIGDEALEETAPRRRIVDVAPDAVVVVELGEARAEARDGARGEGYVEADR